MFIKEFILPFTTGLAIFLFGMQVMKTGFENLFLDRIKSWISKMTNKPWVGMVTGTITTAILQSSSAVTLLTIALTNARMMTFKQALGIILGANIGTCLTVELIAFRFDQWSIYFFLAGVIFFLLPSIKLRSLGLALGGFGLLFIGMETMQAITPYIKNSGMIEMLFMYEQDGRLGGVLAGTLLTALIHSSAATTAITMNLIYEQLIPLTTAIAIVFGSNIGTCVTAVMGSIGANPASKQVALSHVLLNIGGVAFFFFFIPVLATIVQFLTPNVAQQVAHAQTLFNIISSLLVLPFISQFEKLVLFFIPSQTK